MVSEIDEVGRTFKFLRGGQGSGRQLWVDVFRFLDVQGLNLRFWGSAIPGNQDREQENRKQRIDR